MGRCPHPRLGHRQDRLRYERTEESALYYRAFEAESWILGATQLTASSTGFSMSSTFSASMTPGGIVTAASVTGTVTVADGTVDSRAHAPFRKQR